jgi:hypothetical protein
MQAEMQAEPPSGNAVSKTTYQVCEHHLPQCTAQSTARLPIFKGNLSFNLIKGFMQAARHATVHSGNGSQICKWWAKFTSQPASQVACLPCF